MNFVSQLIRHIGSCITAEKGKRIFYAVVNIAFIAIAVLSGWGVLKAWEIMFSETFIGGLLLLIVCATFAFIFNREERGYAICAFIIALLSIAAMVVVIVILLN